MEPDAGHAGAGGRRPPAFAHPSEAEFARILDFYRLEWHYEPRSFPLRRDAGGRVTESFTPDFYLPELDMYIELTTLKQSLVTKKNRKLRLLRELYPEVKIKLLYNRDYRNLLRKYGIQPIVTVSRSDDAAQDAADLRSTAETMTASTPAEVAS